MKTKSMPLMFSLLRMAGFLTLALVGSVMAAVRETTRLDKWSFAAAGATVYVMFSTGTYPIGK